LTKFRDYLAGQISSWTTCDSEDAFSGPCALIQCTDAVCGAPAAQPPVPRRASKMAPAPR
jgi:hypothetical protein